MDRRSPVLVLVTHHVEEIPPGFSHALLLRRGRIVASGPIDEVLTDETLSATFDLPLEVTQAGNRWGALMRQD
jgi:iron complex transport system ATP-binding protein